ncbi:hypothetical protein [Shimia abyssi]|uniref:hypothetical protein n=1 Tax=Shimia abyssi TaxID=1662395 RepID=UPI000D0D8C41|nr:hypothetical protein [Shimia abyssi]
MKLKTLFVVSTILSVSVALPAKQAIAPQNQLTVYLAVKILTMDPGSSEVPTVAVSKGRTAAFGELYLLF